MRRAGRKDGVPAIIISDRASFAAVATLSLPPEAAPIDYPELIRWGADGLAYCAGPDGHIVIVRAPGLVPNH